MLDLEINHKLKIHIERCLQCMEALDKAIHIHCEQKGYCSGQDLIIILKDFPVHDMQDMQE